MDNYTNPIIDNITCNCGRSFNNYGFILNISLLEVFLRHINEDPHTNYEIRSLSLMEKDTDLDKSERKILHRSLFGDINPKATNKRGLKV